MSFAKKKINSSTKGALKAHIESRIQAGYKKKAIFDDLCLNYDEHEKLASMIAQVPYPDDRKKYGLVSFGLALASLTCGLVRLAQLANGTFSMEQVPYMKVLSTALYFWFAKDVLLFRGYAYRILGILAAASIFEINQSPLALALEISIVALAFFLAGRLFPYYGLLRAKRKEDGSYKFGSESVREY